MDAKTALWCTTAGIGAGSANQAAYGKPDAATLAAAYAYGLVHNHPFADGNKRTGWVVARVFLADDGFRLQFDPADAGGVVPGRGHHQRSILRARRGS